MSFELTKKFIVEVKFVDVSGFNIEEDSLSFSIFKNGLKECLYRAVIGGRDLHEATMVIPIKVTEEEPVAPQPAEPVKPEILVEKKI